MADDSVEDEGAVRSGRRATDRYYGPTPGALAAIDRLHSALLKRYLLLVAALVVLGGFALKAQIDSSALARRIQQQRYDVALENCRDQDRRHDATKRRLLAGFSVAFRSPSPAVRRQAARQYSFTVSLIDALAPRTENCPAKARAVVSGG